MRTLAFTPLAIALLPRAPRNASPVPGLTSLYAKAYRGPYGDPRYPGNCGGELIKDLLRYFCPRHVFDPMTGSGTCRDVCGELGINCTSKDIRFGFDACDPGNYRDLPRFDFVWLHPPYWRQKIYTGTTADLSSCPTLELFLRRYELLIQNCAKILTPGGRMAILMGDYSDREAGFVPLVYHTKRLAFEYGLRQACTDIIRFSHGASSANKTYKSSFIPGLHDTCTVFENPLPISPFTNDRALPHPEEPLPPAACRLVHLRDRLAGCDLHAGSRLPVRRREAPLPLPRLPEGHSGRLIPSFLHP